VIGIRHRQAAAPGAYHSPTLDELLQLCIDFRLVSEIRSGMGRVKVRCKDEYFDITVKEAEILARGLLLGFFAMQTKDDLSLADWKG